MLKITSDNYDIYKKTLETIWFFVATKILKIDPSMELSPLNGLNSWEKQSTSLARKILKAGLTDTLTMILDFPHEYKKELNDLLIKKELPSLFGLISIIKDTPQKVLNRKKITTLDEYYVIKNYLSNVDSHLSVEERIRLEEFISGFENNLESTKNAE